MLNLYVFINFLIDNILWAIYILDMASGMLLQVPGIPTSYWIDFLWRCLCRGIHKHDDLKAHLKYHSFIMSPTSRSYMRIIFLSGPSAIWRIWMKLINKCNIHKMKRFPEKASWYSFLRGLYNLLLPEVVGVVFETSKRQILLHSAILHPHIWM